MVNADEAAVSAAIDGEGIVRIFSYKIQHEVANGSLVVLLPDDEPPPVPVHLVTSPDRLSLAKVRTFMDFAAAHLRADFDRETAVARPAARAGTTGPKLAASRQV